MKKLNLLLLLTILTFGILAGCSSSADHTEKNNANNEEVKTEQTDKTQTEESSFPVTITDGAGEKLTIGEKPERIVSVLPSNTEIAFALGLGERIVGVSDHDNYPEEALKKEKVGGLELNVEKILSLKPQLVLAGQTNDEKAIQQLKDSGIPVLIAENATSFEGVYNNITLIGKATGAFKEAQKVIDDMKEKLAMIKEKASAIKEEERKTVYVEISPAPEIYTAGKNTFIDQLLTIIHADNAVADQEGWPKMNEEAVIAMNPDVIVTTYGFYVDNPVEKILKREGWADVPAVKNKQVFDVHSDLVARPGPRLVEGAEELGKAIYPDIFGE